MPYQDARLIYVQIKVLEEDYSDFKNVSDDPVPSHFAIWKEKMTNLFNKTQRGDWIIHEEQVVKPKELAEWCAEHGRQVDRESRKEYVKERYLARGIIDPKWSVYQNIRPVAI